MEKQESSKGTFWKSIASAITPSSKTIKGGTRKQWHDLAIQNKCVIEDYKEACINAETEYDKLFYSLMLIKLDVSTKQALHYADVLDNKIKLFDDETLTKNEHGGNILTIPEYLYEVAKDLKQVRKLSDKIILEQFRPAFKKLQILYNEFLDIYPKSNIEI